ncbi:MAG: zf-TFIIB domain-containing protein [Alphaproteobacteria bacterium]
MPLMTSPIDGSPMRQIHRYGIELDVCPTSGGIWLDKGELEKILHLMREDIEAEMQATSSRSHKERRDYHDDIYKRDDDDYHRYKEKGYYGSGKHYKKEGKMSRIMDLFDF